MSRKDARGPSVPQPSPGTPGADHRALPWFALALRLFLAFEAAEMAVFVTRFSWFGLLDGHHNGFAGGPLGAFEVAILVRAAVLVVCVIGWVRAGEPVPRLERPPPDRTDARVEVPV
jgi:hypothetical protein